MKRGHTDWPATALQALADAWASIDGKAAEFRAGRADNSDRYQGYMEDAATMMERLRRRGYSLSKTIPHLGTVNEMDRR